MPARSPSSGGSTPLLACFDGRDDLPQGQLVEPAPTFFRVISGSRTELIQETECIHDAHFPDQNLGPLSRDLREWTNGGAHGATSSMSSSGESTLTARRFTSAGSPWR